MTHSAPGCFSQACWIWAAMPERHKVLGDSGHGFGGGVELGGGVEEVGEFGRMRRSGRRSDTSVTSRLDWMS
jgi:hypothetical protein